MIKPGMILDFGGEPWKVLHQGVAAPGKPNSSGTSSGRNTGSKGKGVNTKGGGSTGSAGKGVNTKGGSKGANKGKTSLSGPVTNVLENLWSGKKIQMTLHGNFKVLVY